MIVLIRSGELTQKYWSCSTYTWASMLTNELPVWRCVRSHSKLFSPGIFQLSLPSKVLKLKPLRRSEKQMPAWSLETRTDFKWEGHLTDVTTKFRPQANVGMPSSSPCTSVNSCCAVSWLDAFFCRLKPIEQNIWGWHYECHTFLNAKITNSGGLSWIT